MINQSEFPELGDVGRKQDQATSGKDSTSIGHFGSSIAGGKQSEGGPSFASAASSGMFQDSKGAPKMPIFKGKAKLKTGGAPADDVVNSKQNYDFSSMKMSAATSKTAAQRQKEDGEGGQGQEDGKAREPREDRKRGGFDAGRGGHDGGRPRQAAQDDDDDDDDFEEVTAKKRTPQFSRGGRTYGGF